MSTENQVEEGPPFDESKCQRIEEKLRACINEQYSGITFVELVNAVGEDDAKGDYLYSSAKLADLNIYYWGGLSEEFAQALVRIDASGMIECRLASPFIYLYDGRVPSLPIAKRPRKYKDPHWIPTSIRLKREEKA